MIFSALLGDPVPVRLQLPDGPDPLVLGTKFPVARVLDASGALYSTLALEHMALGLYEYPGGFQAPSSGRWVAQFEVFTDSGHATPDLDYDVYASEIAVSAEATFADIGAGAATTAWAQVPDANPSLYPLLRVYDLAGAAVLTVAGQHVASGLYRAQFTSPANGWYTLQWVAYSDAPHTTWDGDYPAFAEPFKVGVSLYPGPRLGVRAFTLRGGSPVFRLASR